MNEIYVAATRAKGSDTVFITPHLDGPYYLFPLHTLLRVIVVLQGNDNITSYVPLEYNEYCLQNGDVHLIDYNRDVHYIRNPQNNNLDVRDRIILKLHYAVTPKYIPASMTKKFIALNINYNSWARDNFLKAQDGRRDNIKTNLLSFIINIGTKCIAGIEIKIGFINLLILVIALSLGKFSDNYTLSVSYLVGFIHYNMYLCNYIFRRIKFGKFIRDVQIFKSISLALLFYLYLGLPINILSLGIATICFVFSYYSYIKLGKKLTYYGVELGICKYTHIKTFPYSVFNHPMIISQICGFLAMLLNVDFANNYWHIILFHIAANIIILSVEVARFKLDKTLSYKLLYEEFIKYHSVRKNLIVHLFSTTIGIFSVMGIAYFILAQITDSYNIFLFAIVLNYMYFYIYTAPTYISTISCIILAVLYILILEMPIFIWFYIIGLTMAIIAQEISHKVYKEPTYFNSYIGKSGLIQKYILHTLLLLPLVISAL